MFESKKSKEVILNVLKADNTVWYDSLISQVDSYFSLDKITDTRLLAPYKLSSNEDYSNYRFRCKSLATIYNYFLLEKNEIKVRPHRLKDLQIYINSSTKFTVEHFIFSDSDNRNTLIAVDDSREITYTYSSDLYKKNINTFFNFIFIPEKINSSLANHWLPRKLEILNHNLDKIECEYTRLYINNIRKLSTAIQLQIKDGSETESIIDSLDLFFSRDFKELYIDFARNLLNQILIRIKQS